MCLFRWQNEHRKVNRIKQTDIMVETEGAVLLQPIWWEIIFFLLTKLPCILVEPGGKSSSLLDCFLRKKGKVRYLRKCNVGAHYPSAGQDETRDPQISTKSTGFCGLPSLLSSKESCLPTQESGLGPWVWKIPWRGKWQLTLVILPGKSHGQGSLEGRSPWG